MNKQELRRSIKLKAACLSAEYKQNAGAVITDKVLHLPVFISCDSIFIYISTENEPSTDRILEAAFDSDKKVYVPKCIDGHTMKAVRIYGKDELIKGMYDIYEPENTDETAEADEIDLALIPCLSASYNGKRLGHGRGYYDRFLENSSIKKICLCFDELISENIPTDKFDIKADMVITENNITDVILWKN